MSPEKLLLNVRSLQDLALTLYNKTRLIPCKLEVQHHRISEGSTLQTTFLWNLPVRHQIQISAPFIWPSQHQYNLLQKWEASSRLLPEVLTTDCLLLLNRLENLESPSNFCHISKHNHFTGTISPKLILKNLLITLYLQVTDKQSYHQDSNWYTILQTEVFA